MQVLVPAPEAMPNACEQVLPEAGLLDLLGLGARQGEPLALLDRLLACSAMYPEPHYRARPAPRPRA